MRAAVLRKLGGPEMLRIEEIDTPVPGPEELLMKIHAVSVNQTLDILVRSGESYKVDLPYIIGNDPSGVVEAVGEGVQGFKKGDRIAAVKLPLEGGGYAEYTIVSAKRADIIPEGVSFADASFVSRHFPMAYSLARSVDLMPDEWVLVMGAAGGLGYAAVQVANHLGARVIAAAGTDERVAAAVTAGAEVGVNYRSQDLAREVTRITVDGANVVYENIADPTLWPGAFNSLATYGRLVTVGAHGGGTVPLKIRDLYNRRIKIMSGLGYTKREDVANALRLAANGTFRALINRVMRLDDIAEAHRLVEVGNLLGKVVIDPTL